MKKILTTLLVTVIMVFGVNCSFASVDNDKLEVIRILGIMNGDENGDLHLNDKVTRSEFVKMLVCASTYKDKVPQVSYYSPYSDVPYTHWSAGYVQLAVEQGWVNGYTDGTFRPNNTITLEEAVKLVLGIMGYTSSDIVGSYPYGQLALYDSLGLDKKISAVQGTELTRTDCVNLFYNMLNANTKNGTKYLQVLGYSQDSTGNIDISKVINENVEGPYVILEDIYSFGINLTNVTVERNEKVSTVEDIKKYDVVYYSDKLNKIWAYSKAVTGTYLSAGSSANSPTSVNIGGTTYSIETSQAQYALSANGEYKVGDVVTALIGREGIVKVIDSKEMSQKVYGVVTANITEQYTDVNGNTYSEKTLVIFGTDGNTYKVKNTSKYKEYEIGDVVEVKYNNGNPSITKKSKNDIYGKVTNSHIGNSKLADKVNIIDTKDGEATKVYLSRLVNTELSKSDVLFYVMNENDEITDLILDDFTGDLNEYALFTNVNESGKNSIYTYIDGTAEKTISVSNTAFGVKEGAGYIRYSGNAVVDIKNLKDMGKVTSISGNVVETSSNTMYIADNVKVYYKDEEDYIVSNTTNLVNNFEDYTVNAYYDDTTKNGGRVRIIIAR